jgi:hypothetical protein
MASCWASLPEGPASHGWAADGAWPPAVLAEQQLRLNSAAGVGARARGLPRRRSLSDSVMPAAPGLRRVGRSRSPSVSATYTGSLGVRDPATRGGAWPPWVHSSRRSFRALVLDADGRGAQAQADARSPVGGRCAGFFPERWRRAGWDRMMDVGSSRLGAFVISNTPRCILVPSCIYI